MPGTDWTAYNLPAIWTMLRTENTCTGADRVTNWEALADDVRTQLKALEQARARLAAAWPPDQNDSARAYLDKMDLIADSMSQTLRRAEDIRSGLRGIIEAIGEAQNSIRPWAEARMIASDDLIPRWADHAEDEYDAKARDAMRKAEAAIADFTPQLDAPPLFNADGNLGGIGDDFPGGAPASASVPVAGSREPAAAGSAFPTPESPPSLSGGAELAGGGAPPAGQSASTLPGGLNVPSGPVPPAPGAGSGLGAAIGAGGVIGGAAVGALGPLRPPSSGGRGPGPQPPQAAPRAPSGPGAPGTPRVTVPPGGVIGGAMPMMPAAGARRPGNGPSGADGQPLVPGKADQLWNVREGVPAIIRPSRRRASHDPGPGVIGRIS